MCVYYFNQMAIQKMVGTDLPTIAEIDVYLFIHKNEIFPCAPYLLYFLPVC
jgi:hypothetical protein